MIAPDNFLDGRGSQRSRRCRSNGRRTECLKIAAFLEKPNRDYIVGRSGNAVRVFLNIFFKNGADFVFPSHVAIICIFMLGGPLRFAGFDLDRHKTFQICRAPGQKQQKSKRHDSPFLLLGLDKILMRRLQLLRLGRRLETFCSDHAGLLTCVWSSAGTGFVVA
jgi:hypothetical protein